MNDHIDSIPSAGPVSDPRGSRTLRRAMRWWPWIALTAVIAAIAGYVASNSQTSVYEAKAVLRPAPVDVSSVLLGVSAQQQSQDTMQTVASLVNLPRVRAGASSQLNNALSPEQIEKATKVSVAPDTSLIELTVRLSNPVLAARAANAVGLAYIDSSKSVVAKQYEGLASQVRARLRTVSGSRRLADRQQARELSQQLLQIEGLQSAAAGGVTLAQPALAPTSRVAPNPVVDALLACLLGALVAFGIAVAYARSDRRIWSLDELLDTWKLPILGIIPDSKALRQSRFATNPVASDQYALALANIRDIRGVAEHETIAVVSALPGEGKSTTTTQLALAAVALGRRVLVVDADLRNPQAWPGRSERDIGLEHVVNGTSTVKDAELFYPIAEGADDGFSVLTRGSGNLKKSMVEASDLTKIVATTAPETDIVLIDTPPATIVPDTMSLVPSVDGIVIVARIGVSKRPQLHRLRDMLSRSETPVLGVIVGGVSGRHHEIEYPERYVGGR